MPETTTHTWSDTPRSQGTLTLPGPAGTTSFRSDLEASAVLAAVERAARSIPPLWPLESFVAVNPFLGWVDRDLDEAAQGIQRAWGSRPHMSRDFYAGHIASGRISDRHIERALEGARARRAAGASWDDDPRDLPSDADALRRAAVEPAPEVRVLPTVASVASDVTGQDWARWVTDHVSAWASTYFDRGQASWPCPWAHQTPWGAWKAQMARDRGPELRGVVGFRDTVAGLPDDAEVALTTMAGELGLEAEGVQPYVARLLGTVLGWTAWVRYLVWEAELREETDTRLTEMAAIRMAYDVALLRGAGADGVREAWSRASVALTEPTSSEGEGDAQVDLLLHEAYELAFQERLLKVLDRDDGEDAHGVGHEDRGSAESRRDDVQAAFCMDVRSEVYRRALEATGDGVRTIGFAGFFGFPIEYVPLGEDSGSARCPALVAPRFVITETTGDPGGAAEQEVTRARRISQAVSDAWLSFKLGAVSSLSFVGPVGLAYIRKLVSDGLGLTPRRQKPASLEPRLDFRNQSGRKLGMMLIERVDAAEGALRGMSLTRNFARIVLLAGHGATTVNNPHASGLDCGACGGRSGEENARVAARALNDPGVRLELMARGIAIPRDTVFVAGRHDTTLDQVVLLDEHLVPAGHAEDLEVLKVRLEEAGRVARAERAPSLGIEDDVDRRMEKRTRDWSQVRPEWGLAGCAAFVAAPRARTRGLDLSGRVFLHDYAWEDDQGFDVLELIMTAPMVVASWISLQYFGSTVDSRVLGAGNKTLHNVVGALGVLEGSNGDLRVGLPWQSVHDGARFFHEPVRLNVVIEAPRDAMSRVIESHPDLRNLLDNRWVHLWAMDEHGKVTHRYAGDLEWMAA